MSLFYAFLQDESNDYYHYLIAFIDRETADEWWRMISTSPSPYATNVKRNSPQFYAQNDRLHNDIIYFFSNTKLPDARQFSRRIFFTPFFNSISERLSITVPPVVLTDHISGRWYFIRAKADPWSHWYLRINGECLVCGGETCDAIHVSSEYRTKFHVRVSVASDFQLPEDFVMIGKDKISITSRKDYALHINDVGDLRATKEYQGETDLLFNDLKDRFVARPEKQTNGEIWEYVESVEGGSGEVWELIG